MRGRATAVAGVPGSAICAAESSPSALVATVFVALAAASACEGRDALSGWREGLEAAAAGRPLSVVCIGDSNTEMTTYVGALRSALQARFGARGVGYHSLGPRMPIPGSPAIERTGRWELWRIAGDPRGARPPRPILAPDGIWASTEDEEASISVTCDSPCAIRLHYQTGPSEGSFAVLSEGRTLARIDARAEKIGYGVAEFDSAAFVIGAIRGRATLFGVDAQRRLEGGAVVHQLGVSCATSGDFDAIESEGIERFLASTTPALVTVKLGTNDMNHVRSPRAYEAHMTSLVAKLRRARPSASIVIVACPETAWTQRSLGARYSGICRVLAERAGALLLDLDAEAGPGGEAWRERGLFLPDNLHYTEAGGREIAGLLLKVLRFEPLAPSAPR